MARWLLVVVAVLVASPAQADFVYSYVGDTSLFTQGAYETGVDHIAGSFVLSDDFMATLDPERGIGPSNITPGVTSYSFSDGHQTLTEANSTASFTVGFLNDGTVLTPGTLSSVSYWWAFSIRTPLSGMSANYLNREWDTVAWMNGENPSGLSFQDPLSYSNPSIDTMRIASGFQTTLIGGLPGAWIVIVTEPSSLGLVLVGFGLLFVVSRHHQGIG